MDNDEAQRLKQFIASVSDYAIYMLSPEGQVVSWNRGAERFKGYTAQEIIGQHFSRFYTEQDRAAGLPQRALAIARETGKFEAEGWRVRKDGTRFWASVVIDPIWEDEHRLIGFTKITRDITERKQAEDALAQAREALFRSQKLEAIGKLTGGVAHDFNNLLNVVTNGLWLMRQRLQDPELLRLIGSMEQAIARGATLTQQLLTFARQQPLKPEPRDVNDLIMSFEAVLRRASRKALRFELDLQPLLPRIMVDTAQFESALLNLVVNAVDATPDGGRIVVSTQVQDLDDQEVGVLPAGRYVAVSVQDTGAGMTPEVVTHAVEPFFTTKPPGQGTGLGLSQVFGMVQQSGGDLAIKSRPGDGATVSMHFPALAEAVKTLSEPAPENAEKVLVVDDQPEVLDTTVEIFRMLGYQVLAARSGEDALDILRRTERIDVLFTDVLMPGMNGVELARKARAAAPQMRILLASGYSAPAGDLHGFEFLAKPYRVADVARKLRELDRKGLLPADS